MTGYERCLVAIGGGVPDRVPGYTPTLACDVASRILGRAVHTGSPSLWYAEARAWTAGESAHAEFEERLIEDRLAVHRAMGNDVFRLPWRRNVRPARQLDDHTFLYGDADGVHEVWRWDPQVMNFLQVKNTVPRRRVEDWPKAVRALRRTLAEQVATARRTTGATEARLQTRLGDTMLVAAGGGGLSLGVDEASLMATALEPGAVADMADGQLEIALAQVEAIAERGLKVVLGGGDMADKNGTLYSPQTFRAILLPRLETLAARCRALGLHYVWRTDGNMWGVSDIIFGTAGVPGYGEVDHDASMTAGRVRDRYPDLAIWANVSGDVLRRGTHEEVYRHSMELLTASRGHAYFHGCSNTILPGTPVANVEAMMAARDDFRPAG